MNPEHNVNMEIQSGVSMKWLFTLLSMSGSGIILAVSVGAWVGKVETKAQAAQEKATELKSVQTETLRYMQSIDQRLSRIEGKLSK